MKLVIIFPSTSSFLKFAQNLFVCRIKALMVFFIVATHMLIYLLKALVYVLGVFKHSETVGVSVY